MLHHCRIFIFRFKCFIMNICCTVNYKPCCESKGGEYQRSNVGALVQLPYDSPWKTQTLKAPTLLCCGGFRIQQTLLWWIPVLYTRSCLLLHCRPWESVPVFPIQQIAILPKQNILSHRGRICPSTWMALFPILCLSLWWTPTNS